MLSLTLNSDTGILLAAGTARKQDRSVKTEIQVLKLTDKIQDLKMMELMFYSVNTAKFSDIGVDPTFAVKCWK